MTKTFRIGKFSFQIEYKDNILFSEYLLLFEEEVECPEYTYHIKYVKEFSKPMGICKHQREDMLIYEWNGLETRYIGITGYPKYYACVREISLKECQIELDQEELIENSAVIFASLFLFERRLLTYDSIVLHTAYVEFEGQAILFSAPSETGKTTQATLWEKHRGAKTINGDRSLLSKVNGVWHAGGWPVCGTSEICNNISLPIRAIVMLSQAPENHVEILPPMKAFSNIYSQITINRWNNDAHMKAMDLIQDLITEIPVYHLACNISEDAVLCLEKMINMES